MKLFRAFAFATIVLAGHALGQPPATLIEVEAERLLSYRFDTIDPTKLATDPGQTSTVVPRNFSIFIGWGDIVAVNRQPAKGIYLFRPTNVNLFVTPTPGQAIADVNRGAFTDMIVEIQTKDGLPIGSLMASGFFGGPPTPGAAVGTSSGNLTITGGTGAYFGARGQLSLAPARNPIPGGRAQASVTEDPSTRRQNGLGSARLLFNVIPYSRPQVLSDSSGPLVVHANDYTIVSEAKPARPGEVLTLYATGLGPTRTPLDPGQAFPSNPLAIVNSPVEVTANNTASEVLYAGGVPGTTDSYQVNFRLPASIGPGSVSLQLVAAFIAGPPVTIPVQ